MFNNKVSVGYTIFVAKKSSPISKKLELYCGDCGGRLKHFWGELAAGTKCTVCQEMVFLDQEYSILFRTAMLGGEHTVLGIVPGDRDNGIKITEYEPSKLKAHLLNLNHVTLENKAMFKDGN